MKKNIGISDRIIRFVAFDLLIGASFMGFETPLWAAAIAFFLSLSLIFTVITGYSVLYRLLGISTRDKDLKNPKANQSSDAN